MSFADYESGRPDTSLAGYQNELYDRGLHGHAPPLPIRFSDPEDKAAAAMAPKVRGTSSAAPATSTLSGPSARAFTRWGLYPRMLIAPEERDMSVELFGIRLPSPIFMAPTGVIGGCAQDGHGDLARAQASVQTCVPFFAGTLSADPMEEVAGALGHTPGFFQLYTPPDREMAASILQRAEAAGSKGIAVTLDTWVTGWGPRDLSGAHYPQVPSDCLTNYTSDPVFGAAWSPARIPSSGSRARCQSSAARSAGTIWSGCGHRPSCR